MVRGVMSRGLVLLVLLAACGGRKEDPARKPPPAAVVGDAGAGCVAGQVLGERGCVAADLDGRAALTAGGARLDDAATLVRQADLLTPAAEVLQALHASAGWRRLAAARPELRPVDAAALRAAPGRLATLARELAYAAGDLRALHSKLAAIATEPGPITMVELRAMLSVHLVSIFSPRGQAIATTDREVFTPLVEPLAAELALVQAEVCAQPEAAVRKACDRLAELRAGSAYLARARTAVREAFTTTAGEVGGQLAALVDDAARSALERATAAAAGAPPPPMR
jgi:hypothetical protein